MTSYLLVVNPKSGRGGGRRRARALRAALESDHRVEVLETRSRGHATTLVEERGGSFERIIAIGGDGTLNEVLTGLLRVDAPAGGVPALGFLASGTANAATRAFGLSSAPDAVARSLENAEVREADVGIASFGGTERPFLLWLGAGYDAVVIRALNSTRTGLMGTAGIARKLPEVLRALRRYPAPEVTARVDGQIRTAASMLVLNVGVMAFGSTASRAADPFDGRMNLVTVTRLGTIGIAGVWARMMMSSLDGASGVEEEVLERARLEAEDSVPFQLDGEPVGFLPVDLRVAPGAVRLLMT